MNKSIGYWLKDECGLPCFRYTGSLPAMASRPDGEPALYPADPLFLLGNYRLTLFAHCSGQYQMMTGERAWGRLNQGDSPNSGANCAEIIQGRKIYSLTGLDSALARDADKVFGVGFAHYAYKLDDTIECVRQISVTPSGSINSGMSAFLIEITLKNLSAEAVDLTYREMVKANYEMAFQQRQSVDERRVCFHADFSKCGQTVTAEFHADTEDPCLYQNIRTCSKYDGFPPKMFLHSDAGDVLFDSQCCLGTEFNINLKPFEQKKINVIIGWAWDENIENIIEVMRDNTNSSDINSSGIAGSAFRRDWMNRLPKFSGEKDSNLRQEMIWHAYCLEAMANYNAYFDETYVPQGTTYDYDSGTPSSARDHMQHALALCYMRPELAKSVLRLMMKKTTYHGEIRLAEQGFGMTTHQFFSTSDQQLYYILLLEEYLRITDDLDFLTETVPFYPVEKTINGTVLEHLEKCFFYLRDEVDTGCHGLVRLLNSDWNDAIYFYVKDLPYPYVYSLAESHLNTAMAVKVIGDICNILQKLPALVRPDSLIGSMNLYRKRLLKALMHELNGRNFLRRFYIGEDRVFGENNLYLEPQCWLLQIPEINDKIKRKVWEEIKTRVLDDEKLGARQLEYPEDNPFMAKGGRENGGVWYALNGPLALGLSGIDKQGASDIFRKMTLKRHAEEFPQYWVGYWSAPDNQDSSLLPSHGLPDQRGTWHEFPVYCGHAHAWPLYCYFKLKEEQIL